MSFQVQDSMLTFLLWPDHTNNGTSNHGTRTQAMTLQLQTACSPFSSDVIIQGSMAVIEGASLTVLPREAHCIMTPVQPQGGVHGEVVRGGDPRWSDAPPEGQGAKGQGLCHGKVHSAGFILAHLPE